MAIISHGCHRSLLDHQTFLVEEKEDKQAKVYLALEEMLAQVGQGDIVVIVQKGHWHWQQVLSIPTINTLLKVIGFIDWQSRGSPLIHNLAFIGKRGL